MPNISSAYIRKFGARWRHIRIEIKGATIAQFVRYFLAGGITAATYSFIYLSLVWWLFPGGLAVLAVPVAFAPTLVLGFFLHSSWSFAGHGMRDKSGWQQGKFLIVHSAGFVLNMTYTWVLTAYLGAPVWTPLIPTVTITPIASFMLQRWWVFA
jgi:putative flippase GtrA